MKNKSYIIIVTVMMVVQSLVVTLADADPGPDYDLLIITPAEFQDELIPLQQFKDATGRPSVIVTLEYIYTHYTGVDEAEEIKKCIADYETNHNIQYVLLVGDVDKLPMRYFYLKRENTTHVGWLQYYLTDHYYADLYDSGGGFCTWDSDSDGIYGEILDYDNDGTYEYNDGIDFTFDTVVGRIPVDTGTQVTTYVNKVISYETGVSFDDAWFKKILLVTGTGDWVYPENPKTWDENESDDIADEMVTAGFSSIKLYHTNPAGSTYPNPTNINDNLNTGMGFMNVISHGNEFSWGVYDVRTNMAGLTNNDKLTIVYSFGCSTAKVGPICPADPYVDVGGVPRNYGGAYSYPILKTSWVEPAVPDPLQTSSTDIACMPEYWNFDSANGAVAFIGSTAEASGSMGSPVMQYFYESIASDGYRVLGDVWNSVYAKVASGGHNIGSDWDHARRWLYINVFGDPSLMLGGLDDKPPVTSLSIGTPKHVTGETTYVTSTTGFTLTATDDHGIVTTYYRYYPSPSWPSWSTGTSFTLSGSDGEYLVEYYSVDTGGNTDYPIKSKEVTLDTQAPTTTLSIGTPKYTAGTDTYITSSALLTLTATDTGCGVQSITYDIDGAGWMTYSAPFHVSGSDGSHTISYRSTDNLDNEEPIQNTIVLLDNTPPITTMTIGDPVYSSSGNTYVTSYTDLTLSATDAGSGVDYKQYRINAGGWSLYAGAFHLSAPDGSYLVEYRGVDNLGNTETAHAQTLILDDSPPETTLTIGDPTYTNLDGDVYVTSDTDLTLSATDTGSGVDYTRYRINEGSWITYATAFHLIGPDGPYQVEFYSVDHLGNTETTQSQTLLLDNTPPQVSIELPGDGFYVYGVIPIEINATDEGSGVHHVDYSLDDGTTWLPATYDPGLDRWIGLWDTTASTEGSHTIQARAQDNVENVGSDETPPTVTVVYLDYEIEFSDSDWNAIEDFTVVFNEQKPGEYKISTNPGSLYEIITLTNTGTLVTLPEVIFDVIIPIETGFLGTGEEAFEFLGAKSVHVYLNGVDVTPGGKWLPTLHNVNVLQELAPGDTLEIYLHYEYAFKGEKYMDPDVSAWPGEEYLFETDLISAYGPSWTSSLSAVPLIIEL